MSFPQLSVLLSKVVHILYKEESWWWKTLANVYGQVHFIWLEMDLVWALNLITLNTYKSSTQIYLSVWIFQPPSPSAGCLFPACAHPEYVHDPVLDSGACLEVHSIASSSLHAGTDLVVCKIHQNCSCSTSSMIKTSQLVFEFFKNFHYAISPSGFDARSAEYSVDRLILAVRSNKTVSYYASTTADSSCIVFTHH